MVGERSGRRTTVEGRMRWSGKQFRKNSKDKGNREQKHSSREWDEQREAIIQRIKRTKRKERNRDWFPCWVELK